jgi:hypothetical protein
MVLLGEGYALTRIVGDFVSVGAYFGVYGLLSRGILNIQMFCIRLETTSYGHERTHMPPQRPSWKQICLLSTRPSDTRVMPWSGPCARPLRLTAFPYSLPARRPPSPED